MFPIPWNKAYRKKDGTIINIDDAISGGGQSGGRNILTGATIPSNSMGNEGDIYLLTPNEVYQTFNITITKALRGSSEQNYFGAQEIQLLLTNGTETKDIIQFPDFACSGPGPVAYAFNGDTGGSYWEGNGLPGIVNFGAKIPIGWEIDKLIVWQRNSSSYLDVWKDFTFSVNGVTVLNETDLTTDNWAGPGSGTEFEIPSVELKKMESVYYKVNYNGSVVWIS